MILRLLKHMEIRYNRIPRKPVDVLFYAAFSLVLVYDYAFLSRFDREKTKT